MPSPRSFASLVVALLLLFGTCAHSDDGKRALRPFVTKGDTWTYRNVTSPGSVNSIVRLETVTVTVVDEKLDVIHATIDQRPEGAKENRDPEQNGIWTSDWNAKLVNRPDVRRAMMHPHGGVLRFPMKVGDSYDTSYELTTATKEGPGATFRIKRKTRVDRWEEVNVPAGKFMAIVIESDGTVEQLGSGRTWRSVTHYWYSPDVRRPVKFSLKYWPNDLESELVSFKLSEVQ